MAYAPQYYPDSRHSNSQYKLEFRDHLSHGFKYGQSWSTDPERRELERAYNDADRYQRDSYGYYQQPYTHASSLRHSGSHYTSPHDEAAGALVRHPTAAHADPYAGSNHSVSESVLAGYNDPPEPVHRSHYPHEEVTPEVIRTRSHDGGYSIEPARSPAFHPRSHGGYRWNPATGSSISSFRADSIPESRHSYASYGTYRDPETHYASDDDDTDSSQSTPYHSYHRSHHSHSRPEYDHHHHHHQGHSAPPVNVYDERGHSDSSEEDGYYAHPPHPSSYHPHDYHGYHSGRDSPRGYLGDESDAHYGDRDEYDFDLERNTRDSYSDTGRHTPLDYDDEIYYDYGYGSDGDYSHDDYDDDDAYYSDY